MAPGAAPGASTPSRTSPGSCSATRSGVAPTPASGSPPGRPPGRAKRSRSLRGEAGEELPEAGGVAGLEAGAAGVGAEDLAGGLRQHDRGRDRAEEREPDGGRVEVGGDLADLRAPPDAGQVLGPGRDVRGLLAVAGQAAPREQAHGPGGGTGVVQVTGGELAD